MCTDKFNYIVDIYYNTYHIECCQNIEKDSKLRVGDHKRISKHKNFFAKGRTPN